ncbi:MAG: lipid-A-disaccharide synthase [Gemmataceae bacterium]
MRLFISVGEPSGDLHAATLIRELRRRLPDVEIVGFGGEKMEAAGCQLLYPLCQLAVMWFLRVLANIHVFLGLIFKADRYFRHHKPDALILIDYPGFNLMLARRAALHGIPVFYFLPPQVWAWDGDRVKRIRKYVDHVLCALPFEQEWYAEHYVNSHWVGHPYFDELTQQELDDEFLNSQRAEGSTIIGLLPGSRTQEVEKNFQTMLETAKRIHKQRPDTKFLVANFKEQHRKLIELQMGSSGIPIETYVGRTPEIIELAHSCISVSGSVGLELMYRTTPTAVLYKVTRWEMTLAKWLKTCDYISLVNLIAKRELFPEFLVDYCPAQELSELLLGWLHEPEEYSRLVDELGQLRDNVGEPGASARVGAYIAEALGCGSVSGDSRRKAA